MMACVAYVGQLRLGLIDFAPSLHDELFRPAGSLL